jgi:superfamily II DNA or RNA helicase
MIKLFKHQEEAISLYKQREGKLYLNWETGTGKTIGALAIANAHGFKKLLVVAPKSSHLSWATEKEHFKDLVLDIITYEAFRDKINDFTSYDFLIFDEAHRLKNPSAKITKKAVEYAVRDKLPPRILLSGTPADRYYELYSQLKVLNPEDKTFTKHFSSYTKFINFFYYLDKYYKPERLRSKDYEKWLKEWFLDYAHVVKKEDVVELPPLTEIPIRLPKQKIDIDIEDLSLYTVNTFITEFRKSVSKQKIEWVLDFLEDNPDTIVFSLFREPTEQIKQKLGDRVYLITGKYRKEFDIALQKQDKPIIATYSLKEGANLQKYSNIVMLAPPLSYRDYQQSIARVYRTGQTKKVSIYKLLQNSIDYKVYAIIKEKGSVYDYLRKEVENALH